MSQCKDAKEFVKIKYVFYSQKHSICHCNVIRK